MGKNYHDWELIEIEKKCLNDMRNFQIKIKEQYYWTYGKYNNMPFERREDFTMHTTEDFFTWREEIKYRLGGDGKERNKIVESAIAGNETMELLYAWSKFSRVIDGTRAYVYHSIYNKLMADENYNQEVLSTYKFNPSPIINTYLSNHLKKNQQRLFDAVLSCNIGLNPNFKPFNTAYEFQKLLYDEETHPYPWGITCLIVLLKAYGITEENFSAINKMIEKEGVSLVKAARELGIKTPKSDSKQRVLKRNPS